jgi:apolipoprotein N-acyltransferase
VILRRDRQAAVIAGIVLVLAHLWGAAAMYTAPHGPMLKVVAIQPNIQIEDRKTEEGRRADLERLEQLTRKAAINRPALVVWPESAIPGDLRSDSELVDLLQHLTDEIDTPLIVGASQVEKFATGESEIRVGRHIFNTAYLFKPGEPLGQPYRKRVLVPFAEYLPHVDTIPWPEWLAPRVAEMTAGDRGQLFHVSDALTVGALICWENLFSALARESVGNGAQVLVQLTNDVWFGRSAAPRQHNLMSVMRAVENRVPVVIASNTGPSQIIDGYGHIVAGVPNLFQPGIIATEVRIDQGPTFYTVAGDSVVLFGLMVLAVWVSGWYWSIHRRRSIPLAPDRGMGKALTTTMNCRGAKEVIR